MSPKRQTNSRFLSQASSFHCLRALAVELHDYINPKTLNPKTLTPKHLALNAYGSFTACGTESAPLGSAIRLPAASIVFRIRV